MSRFVLPQESTFDINGLPQNGAILIFHNPGLLTDKQTFSDEALTIPNTNPVVADASGNFGNIWLIGDYDVTLKNAADLTIWGPERVNSNFTGAATNSANESTVSAMVNSGEYSPSDVGITVVTTAKFLVASSGDSGGTYDIVLTSSVAPNPRNILVGVSNDLISFVLREGVTPNLAQWGAIADGLTDNTSIFVAAGRGYVPKGAGRYIVVLDDIDWREFFGEGELNLDGADYRALSVISPDNGRLILDGGTIRSSIRANQTEGREELQVYSGADSFSTNSEGSGLHLYGNRDEQHAGNFTVLTGQPDNGTARLIVSGGSFRLAVTSITRATTTATVTTAIDHDLTTGMLITIDGAIETDYNVIQEAITVTSDDEFTYAVANDPTTPATGTIIAVPGEGARLNTDTRVTIGNSIFDFTDELNDTALLNLKNPQGRPAILFLETNSTTEGEEAVPTGESWSLGHWDAPTEVYTPRMYMDTLGEFYIGRTSGITINSHFAVEAQDGSHRAGDFYVPTAISTNDVIRVYSDVGGVETNTFSIEADGDVLNVNNSYGALSDARYKNILGDAESQWDDCKNINWIKYQLKNHVETMGDDAPVLLGVTTQQLQENGMAGLTGTKEAELNAEGEIISESFNTAKYSVITMKYHIALQEAMARIETLEDQIKTLL